jgi:hypothetical protein
MVFQGKKGSEWKYLSMHVTFRIAFIFLSTYAILITNVLDTLWSVWIFLYYKFTKAFFCYTEFFLYIIRQTSVEFVTCDI